MRACAISLFLAFVGCQSGGDSAPVEQNENNTVAATNTTMSPTNNTNAQTTATPTTGADCGTAAVVSFETSDGETLVADFQPASRAGRGAVILFHMIPPTWDRKSFPRRVRDAVHALDLNVLNVDRRGAGESTGTALDAYQGATASLDVEAAVRFLVSADRVCAIDAAKIMLVGASNGTTSVYDYTVARSDSALPSPAAMVWLSPGDYTQSQNRLSDHRTVLDSVPLLIIHPDNEPWATQLQAVPEGWKIVEIESGRHGTQNFDDGAREAVQLSELVEWARTHVAQ